MICKNCGGEVLLENGKGTCQNCGTVFSPEKVYENIDVYICYVESDASGRRTKDSILAQDVYRKLEEKKIATFYERISADGLIGDQLELSRYSALWAAKAVLVLGTSAEHFKLMEERYSAYFGDKPVIPFCADVNPSVIPKTLSKIQAVNAATIGWEKDLISGLYNLLGKSREVDTNSLFSTTRKKIFIIVGAVMALLAAGLTVFLLLGNPMGGKEDPAATAPTETLPPTPQEIFDQASGLVEQGSYFDALTLLLQIPEHNGTASLLKQIYGKYEGYYQNDQGTTHLDVIENTQVKLSVIVRTGEKAISLAVNTDIVDGKLSYQYVDNYKATGTLEMQIVNTGLQLIVTPDDGEPVKISHALEEKSDQPLVQLDKATIVEWINKKYSLAQLKAIFFEVEKAEDIVIAEAYYIPEANIYVYMSSYDAEKAVVYGVSAPAEWVAPELVGKNAVPAFKKDVLYIPNAKDSLAAEQPPHTFRYFQEVDKKVTNDTLVAVYTKKGIKGNWNEELWNVYLRDAAFLKALHLADKRFDMDMDVYSYWNDWPEDWLGDKAQNKTYYLFPISHEGQFVWYKVKKSNLNGDYLLTGSLMMGTGSEEQSVWYTEYIDLAEEFPETFYAISDGQFGSFAFTVKKGCTIYEDYNYESAVVGELGSCTVYLTAEQKDAKGRHWCKLRSGEGWICITDILAGK